MSLWIRPKKGWEEEYKWILWELEILTALHNYLVPLESLKCWLGGAPGGRLVQSPPHSWTPARTRSGKRSLCLSKSWKHLCGGSYSLCEQPTHFLMKFLQMSSLSLPSHSLWPVPLAWRTLWCSWEEFDSIIFGATLWIVVGFFLNWPLTSL